MKQIILTNTEKDVRLEAVGISVSNGGPTVQATGDMYKSVYDTNGNNQVDKSENTDKLDGYSVSTLPITLDLRTEIDSKEDKFTKNTAFNKNFGTGHDDVVEGNDSRFDNIGNGDMLKSVYDTDDNGQVDKSDNADKLGGYSASELPITDAEQTALDNKEDKISKNTAFNKNFGTTTGTVAEGNDSRIVDIVLEKSVYDTNDNGIVDNAEKLQGYTANELPISNPVQDALDNKEDAFTKNTAFNKNFGTTAGTVLEGDDSRLNGLMEKSVYDTDDNGQADKADNSTKLQGYTPSDIPVTDNEQTELDTKEPAFTKNTAFNVNFGDTSGTAVRGDDPRLNQGTINAEIFEHIILDEANPDVTLDPVSNGKSYRIFKTTDKVNSTIWGDIEYMDRITGFEVGSISLIPKDNTYKIIGYAGEWYLGELQFIWDCNDYTDDRIVLNTGYKLSNVMKEPPGTLDYIIEGTSLTSKIGTFGYINGTPYANATYANPMAPVINGFWQMRVKGEYRTSDSDLRLKLFDISGAESSGGTPWGIQLLIYNDLIKLQLRLYDDRTGYSQEKTINLSDNYKTITITSEKDDTNNQYIVRMYSDGTYVDGMNVDYANIDPHYYKCFSEMVQGTNDVYVQYLQVAESFCTDGFECKKKLLYK